VTDHQWEEPGAVEVAPGIHRLALPLPTDALKATNVYAIVDGDHLVLIDAGMAIEQSEMTLRRSLATLGYAFGDIRDFLVTHVHHDHYTQAVAIRRTHGSRVSLGENERRTLEAMRTVSTLPDFEVLREAGADELLGRLSPWMPPSTVNLEDPDRWLLDGVDLHLETRRLRVIATPGHTRGHVVFHDPEARVLFTGDHVLPHITPSIGVELPRALSPETPLRSYLASLQLMLRLPDSDLLPAHGPSGGSTHARVHELLHHHEIRLSQAVDALARGASTGYEVATLLPWTRRGHAFLDLDQFNQLLAINETLAHLHVLVERGWATRHRMPNGVVHFELDSNRENESFAADSQ
jgi:glyoxylase-like metal-dependent hydrolase (beta-lactamase superfamily II)